MDFRRIRQVFRYGWKDAEEISKDKAVQKSRNSIFLDILYCFFRYNVWSNQYKKEQLYLKHGTEKEELCRKYQEENDGRDRWVKAFFDNYRFLDKWSSFRYERSARLQAKRRSAYREQYGLGENCFVGYDVKFHKHHFSPECLRVGNYCQISEHVDLDFTGGLIVGNGVGILEGVKILTHGHDYLGIRKKKDLLPHSKRAYLSPLEIADNVTIGTRAVIMPGVRRIGRNAMISAGAVVTREVPDYAVVAGNPAQVIGSIEGMNVYQRSETL